MSCQANTPAIEPTPAMSPPLPEVSSEAWAARGQITQVGPIEPPVDSADTPLGAAWRAVYTSASGVDGGIRHVTGAFFVPGGIPPEDGWPVISFAHPTTGIANGCGPSTDEGLLGLFPVVEAFLGEGYAVAVSDYEGLGNSGIHPYLEPRTAAFNIIDAVRALREISPGVSPRWIAVGDSQGGQAAWAANELNGFYGNGIELQGAVALSPATDISELAGLVQTGSLTKDQQVIFPLLVVGLEPYNPDLDGSHFLHGRALANKTSLDSCESPISDWNPMAETAEDLKPDSRQDVDFLRNALRRIALPMRPLDKPMLVINGALDKTVFPEWVKASVSRSCQMGGKIQHLEIPGGSHADLTPEAYKVVQTWISDRFDGKEPYSNCREQS